MAKKEKVYKIRRGEAGGPSRLWVTAGALLCVAAAFVLAYFWQYGAPGAAALTGAPAALQSSSLPQESGLPLSEASCAQGSEPAAEAGAASTASARQSAAASSSQALVVPQPAAGAPEGAQAGAALAPEIGGESEALVVGGALPVSSAQEVGGEKKDFSVAYQVQASEAVENSYFEDALFVGDSITTGIDIYGAMAGAAVVASTGINPSTILTKPCIRDVQGNLHTILETMSRYDPQKIYVLLGANGIGWIEQGSFIDYYAQLLDRIQEQHPDALVYVQSIFPVTAQKSLGENGIYSNERIDAYNAALMELCRKRGLPYLNVAEALRGPDGALPAEASGDGIHIIPDYYRRWFDYLKTHTAAPQQKTAKKPEDTTPGRLQKERMESEQ